MKRWVVLYAGLLVFAGCVTPRGESEKAAFAAVRRALPGAKIRRLHDGVLYATATTDIPARVHVVAVDLAQPGLVVKPVLGHDRLDGGTPARETIGSMARRTGALALMNGDYTSEERNVEALTVIDGRVLFSPDPPKRAGMVLGADGTVRFGLFGMELNESARRQAVGGGPKMMEAGVFRWDTSQPGLINGEDFPRVAPGRWDIRHPLTAYCATSRPKTLLLVAVDGRSPGVSLGMTPWELGRLLKDLDCQEALRLDGGGSTGLTVGPRLMTLPPEGHPEGRPIGIALGIFKAPKLP